jgi:hypothetical protein
LYAYQPANFNSNSAKQHPNNDSVFSSHRLTLFAAILLADKLSERTAKFSTICKPVWMSVGKS